MTNLLAKVKRASRKLLSTGFFDIVGAGFLNKVLMFFMSLVLVRVLSKVDYGVYAYAYNIVSFFLILNGLGATSAILQICSERYDDQTGADRVYAYGYVAGIVADIVMAVVIAVFSFLFPLAVEGSNEVLLMYCAYPLLLFTCDIKLTYLRARLMNRDYALMTNLQTVLTVILSILGVACFGVRGLVGGQCLANLITWLVMCARYPHGDLFGVQGLSKREVRDYWGLALVSALNNALSQALTLVGTLLIGAMLVDAVLVADYKVATAVPFALLFIPGVIVTYAYPQFAKKRCDRAWTLRNYGRLIGASVITMGAISIALGMLAEPLVMLVFGEQYMGSVPVFRLLLVGFFITASFRQPTGNLLVTQRKLGFNAFNNIISILFNVAASFILIPPFGLMGAAAVYDMTVALGTVLNVPYYISTVRKLPSR